MFYTDMHCHIIPGVDDGSYSMELSLKMLQREYEDGVRSIILTPHYRIGMFETADEVIRQRYSELVEEASRILPDLSLYLGREYHAHTDMLPDFYEGSTRISTMCGSEYVLLEFSADKSLSYIKARTKDLLDIGLTPIIAHIERYPSVVFKPEFVSELHTLGAMVQINAGALTGEDGWTIKGFCKKLLKEELVDFIATDCHDLKRRPPNLIKAIKYVEKKAGIAAVDRIFHENPMMIIYSAEE